MLKETKRGAAAIPVKRQHRKALLLTTRDQEIVRWVHVVGVATREQVHKAFFSTGGRSRCQARLTLLVRHRYLDALPGRRVNEPQVYCVSRRSVNGRRFLRADGQAAPRSMRISPAKLQHTLDIVSCRAQIGRACIETGMTLLRWVDEAALMAIAARNGIVPDAYFQLARNTAEGERRSSFFVEVERSGKSERALREKIRRYGEFYYSGRFEQLFESRALRVLVLVGADYGIRPDRQIERLLAMAEELGVTLLRFAPFTQFVDAPAVEAFLGKVWSRPGTKELSALFGSGDPIEIERLDQ